MAGRQGICMERSKARLTSVCSDTRRQQLSAQADNEDRALTVKTRIGRKDDTGRGNESTRLILLSAFRKESEPDERPVE